MGELRGRLFVDPCGPAVYYLLPIEHKLSKALDSFFRRITEIRDVPARALSDASVDPSVTCTSVYLSFNFFSTCRKKDVSAAQVLRLLSNGEMSGFVVEFLLKGAEQLHITHDLWER